MKNVVKSKMDAIKENRTSRNLATRSARFVREVGPKLAANLAVVGHVGSHREVRAKLARTPRQVPSCKI